VLGTDRPEQIKHEDVPTILVRCNDNPGKVHPYQELHEIIAQVKNRATKIPGKGYDCKTAIARIMDKGFPLPEKEKEGVLNHVMTGCNPCLEQIALEAGLLDLM
jgi:hypothetical protein